MKARRAVSIDRLLDLIDRFAAPRIVVFGDLIADEFVYGRVARVSREAPVLILEYDSTEMLPGGAGNAAHNAAALGGRVIAGRPRRPRRAGATDARGVAAARRARRSRAARRLSDAGQDAHPRRRHPFRQATGRAHRSADRGRRPTRTARRVERAASRAVARRRRAAGVGLRRRARDAGVRRRARRADPRDRPSECRCWSTRATR